MFQYSLSKKAIWWKSTPVFLFPRELSVGSNKPLHTLIGPAGFIRPRRYSHPQIVVVLHSIYLGKAVRRAVKHADWRPSLIRNDLVGDDRLGSIGCSPPGIPAFAFRLAHEIIHRHKPWPTIKLVHFRLPNRVVQIKYNELHLAFVTFPVVNARSTDVSSGSPPLLRRIDDKSVRLFPFRPRCLLVTNIACLFCCELSRVLALLSCPLAGIVVSILTLQRSVLLMKGTGPVEELLSSRVK